MSEMNLFFTVLTAKEWQKNGKFSLNGKRTAKERQKVISSSKRPSSRSVLGLLDLDLAPSPVSLLCPPHLCCFRMLSSTGWLIVGMLDVSCVLGMSFVVLLSFV